MTIERLYEETMNGAASLWGAGLVAGLVLIGLLLVLLPRDKRSSIKLPALLLVAYVVFMALLSAVPHNWPGHSRLSLIALFLLLASMGRSGFLLIVDSIIVAKLTRPFPKIFRDILQTLIYAAVVFATLRAAGVEPSSLLTTSAVLTAVIGLSLQETLGNMFAGLSLQAQQPFEVGDWVQVDADETLSGRVIEVNWRETKLLTESQMQLIIPNGALAKAPIRNYSKPTRVVRREIEVLCHYETPPRTAHATILAAIDGVPGVLAEPPPSVITRQLADSGVLYTVRFFIDTFAERRAIEGAVLDRVWYGLARANITIPYPTRVSHVQDVSDESRARAEADRHAEHLEAIGMVDIFEAIPADQREQLASTIRSVIYGPGEVVIRADAAGDELFIVEQGEVVVSIKPAGSGTLEVNRLGPGQFFGEMSLMTGARRTATVMAVEETVLVVVSKEDFQIVLEANPSLAESISETLARRQEQLADRSMIIHADNDPIRARSSDLLRRIQRFFSLG